MACPYHLLHAQSVPTIELGSKVLRLGMEQQEVIAALGGTYHVTVEARDSGSALLLWQGTGSERILVATLDFRHGKLRSAVRHWGPDDQDKGIPLANAFYGLARQFVDEGRNRCILKVFSSQDPESESRIVELDCSGKRILVGIAMSSRYGNGATVEEALSEP